MVWYADSSISDVSQNERERELSSRFQTCDWSAFVTFACLVANCAQRLESCLINYYSYLINYYSSLLLVPFVVVRLIIIFRVLLCAVGKTIHRNQSARDCSMLLEKGVWNYHKMIRPLQRCNVCVLVSCDIFPWIYAWFNWYFEYYDVLAIGLLFSE